MSELINAGKSNIPFVDTRVRHRTLNGATDRDIDYTPNGILAIENDRVSSLFPTRFGADSQEAQKIRSNYKATLGSPIGVLGFSPRKGLKNIQESESLENEMIHCCDCCGRSLYAHGVLNHIGSERVYETYLGLCVECEEAMSIRVSSRHDSDPVLNMKKEGMLNHD